MPVPDRVVGQQALVLAFAAEHDLSLTVVPEIIKLAQELSTDSAALKHLAMDRTTASYKLTHGLAQTIDELIVNSCQSKLFSLNVDESTCSTNNQRVNIIAIILKCCYSLGEWKLLLRYIDIT